jgi:hypothetical protein
MSSERVRSESDSEKYIPESYLRTGFYSLALAIASVPITIAVMLLFFVLIETLGIWERQYDWVVSLPLASYATIGFLFGYLYRCRFSMIPVVVGWSVFCASVLWLDSDQLSWTSWQPYDVNIIYASWLAAMPLAAIFGTAVGRSLRQNRDRARVIFFALAVAAFMVYYRIALPVVIPMVTID